MSSWDAGGTAILNKSLLSDSLRITRKKLILVFTQGNPDSSLFQSYFDYTKYMVHLLEFDVKGLHVVAGMRNEPAHERKDLHISLKDIGSSLVSEQTREVMN